MTSFPLDEGHAGRKLLAAREDLAGRISEIASRKGLTLYRVVNDALASVVTMEDTGLTFHRAVEQSRLLAAAKNAGFVLCPEALWFEIVEQAYRLAPQQVTQAWFDAGARCAKLFKVRENTNALPVFIRDITALVWNAPEFTFDVHGDEIFARCICPKFSKTYAPLFGRFLEGALDALGYEPMHRDVDQGAIQLRFRRKRVNGEAR